MSSRTPTDRNTGDSRRVSRRSFLIRTGGVSVVVAFGAVAGDCLPRAAAQDAAGAKPNAWVTILPDGTIMLVSPSAEMGQGVMTAMPALIAEDMDADWKNVVVVQAPADAKSFGNPLFGGAQVTGASRTTQAYYTPLRLVGAQTRKLLIAHAAERLGVPAGDLATEPGFVVHKASNRRIGYGDLAKTLKVPETLPAVTAADLKPLAQCRFIGKDVPRVDIPLKVNGTAKFGIDVQLPGMLHGAVLRAPVQGEKPEKIDDAAAKAVKGVRLVVPLPYGVGIIADTVEAARKAKAALKVEWSKTAKARGYDSDKIGAAYLAVARDAAQRGIMVESHGDIAKALAGAARTIEAEYLADHVAHACMEPMNATARLTGDSLELWVPTQSPTLAQVFGARMAGTAPPKVKVNTMLLGGGFGRRIEPDFTIDAVLLAKAASGAPVKVMWSREDDIQHDKYRPLAAQHLTVALDKDGNIAGWRHRLVGESIYARANPAAYAAAKGKDAPFHEGAEVKYAFPSHDIEFVRQQSGIDVGFWRAVGPGYTKFAIETMIDDIARAKKQDPIAFRLALLQKEPRARAVIEEAAKMAEWSRKRDGRLLGIAYSDAWNTHCAQVAEISLDRGSGEIRVYTVWCAVDPGVAVQPDNVVAQIESSIIYGISHALYEQITIKGGEVQQANLDSYRVLRMAEAPDIHVKVMPSLKDPPGGMGEVGLPPIAPAIANAIAAATGKTLRQLPMNAERVKAALKA